MELTADERRARPPWEDYDVPEDQQIIRFGGSGPQMSMGDGSAVVFRDDIISVVKKYGIAAAISAYGMDQVQQAMGESEPQNPLMQGY